MLVSATDSPASENPYEARLGFCVKLDASDFIGRRALVQQKVETVKQRLCTLMIGGPEYLNLYGGEAVLFENKVVSRLRSAGYGHTIQKNIGFAYLPVDLIDGDADLEVEIFDQTVPAEFGKDRM